MNTKMQLSQRTDLSILPNSVNAPVSNSYWPDENCAASGFLYFDDGVSYEKSTSRFDIFFEYDATAPTKLASVVFKEAPGNTYSTNSTNEQVGVISIFNPFGDDAENARKIVTATVQLKAGGDPIDITNQVYYEDTYLNQVVFIDMRDTSKTVVTNFRFDEIDRVTITYP